MADRERFFYKVGTTWGLIAGGTFLISLTAILIAGIGGASLEVVVGTCACAFLVSVVGFLRCQRASLETAYEGPDRVGPFLDFWYTFSANAILAFFVPLLIVALLVRVVVENLSHKVSHGKAETPDFKQRLSLL